MAIYAHVIGGTVANVIVADDQAVADAVAPDGATAVDVTGLPVGIGWTWDGTSFAPPPVRELLATATTLVANGTSSVVVTYRDTHPDAPATIVFTTNGATTTVALTDGVAELEVTATSPGPVTVTAGGSSVTLTAVAP